MAGTLSLKSVNSAPKQLSRTGLTIPIIIVFLIGFFFVSSLKVRVVYSTAPSNSGLSEAKKKKEQKKTS